MAASLRGIHKLLCAKGLLCRELGQSCEGHIHAHSNARTSTNTSAGKEAYDTAQSSLLQLLPL